MPLVKNFHDFSATSNWIPGLEALLYYSKNRFSTESAAHCVCKFWIKTEVSYEFILIFSGKKIALNEYLISFLPIRQILK